VLICKDPPRLQVEVSEATVAKAITTKNRDQLVSTVVGHLKTKTYDKAQIASAFASLARSFNYVTRPAKKSHASLTILSNSPGARGGGARNLGGGRSREAAALAGL
jgi:hypothetical protein